MKKVQELDGAELDYFDSTYRGPEVHKASTLRAHLLAGKTPNSTELLQPLNRGMNTIWQNALNIVAGGYATFFTDLHLQSDGTVDPRYSADAAKKSGG